MTAVKRKMVVFRLGDDRFAADVHDVERVLRWQAPRAIPDLPDWVDGVVEYQGRMVPVIGLRRRFELPDGAKDGTTRIIVMHGAEEWVGVVVDEVLEVSTYDPEGVQPPPAIFRGLAGEYLRGLVGSGESLTILLDVKRLLSTSERLTLARAVEAGAQ
ncbi:MAG: chemotaxis protein CheW [Gemmatimonadaceae bacterium]